MSTLLEINKLVRDADALFDRAARAWTRGNNSGDSAILERCEKQCDALRRQAEKLLTPLGITVDYPGLYPSFTVGSYGYHSTESAVSAALAAKAGAV